MKFTISGLRVTLNATNPRSIISVLAKESDEYEPLEMDKMYQVTTLDFLKRGGGGFKVPILLDSLINIYFIRYT